jgi:Tol biopolymer transport system component
VFLPDGNHFLYLILSSVIENAGFFVGSLDSKSTTRLAPLPTRLNGWGYAPPGYLLQSNGPQLNAQRFDANSLKLEGQPITLADGIEAGYFSFSDTGLLLYRKGANAPPTKQLTWFDRAGKPVGQLGSPENYGNVDISPAGDRVAVDMIANNNRDIWVIDVARAVPSRITFDAGPDWSPSWSPDGGRLIFASTRAGGTHAYTKSSSGVGNDEIVFKSDSSEIPVSWSHDGRHVVFSRPARTESAATIRALDLSGERRHRH